MSASERRTAHRFILSVPLQLQLIQAPSLAARELKTMNISTRGVYFATDLPICQGQLVQVLLQMPKEISGNVMNERRFTGRVAHVDSNGFANGMSGVGVQFLRYGEIAGTGKFGGPFDPTGIAPQSNPTIPWVRDRQRVAVRPLSGATISMSFLLTPMRWDFVSPTSRARDFPPRF
jgi:hypothetical protein